MKTLGVTQHDSHSCGIANHGVQGFPFPRPRAGTEHVGAVYEFDGEGREAVRDMDLALLIGHRGAHDCIPPTFPSSGRASLSLSAAMDEAEVLDAEQLRSTLEALSWAGGTVSATAGSSGAFATAWSDAASSTDGNGGSGGSCAHRQLSGAVCMPTLLVWRDAFVDALLSGAGGGRHTFVFTYEAHVLVGFGGVGGGGLPAPLQYHERVPDNLEPISALSGGARYFPALLLVDDAMAWESALNGGGSGAVAAGAAVADWAAEDLPRLLLRLARPGTLTLLPPRVAAAARDALQQMGAAALSEQVVEHEEGGGVLYFAAEVYVQMCKCAR